MALRNPNNIVTIAEEIKNTSVRIITITEDRLENILNKHFSIMKKPKDIIAALAIVITVLGTLFTSSFQDKFGLKADTWNGIFVCILILSIIYLSITVINRCKSKTSVKSIIKDIKNIPKNNENN